VRLAVSGLSPQGRVTALAITPDGDVFVSAGLFGIYKSSNGGISWNASHAGIPIRVPAAVGQSTDSYYQASVLTVAADGAVYASLSDYGYYNAGVYRLGKGAAAWVSINGGLNDDAVVSLASASDGSIYAASRERIFKLDNGGNTWAPVNTDLRSISWLATSGKGSVYAATKGYGVFRSGDGGISWQPVKGGLGVIDVPVLAIAGDGSLYAGANGAGVFKSSDDSHSWRAVNNGLSDVSVVALVTDTGGTAYAGTSAGVFKRSRGSARWVAANNGFPYGMPVSALLVAPDGSVYAGTSRQFTSGLPFYDSPAPLGSIYPSIDVSYPPVLGSGVYKSSNGGELWTPVNNGLSDGTIDLLALGPAGTLYASTPAGIFKSSNGGGLWSLLNNTLPPQALVVAADGSMYAHSYGILNNSSHTVFYAGVFKSSDGGANWISLADNASWVQLTKDSHVDSGGFVRMAVDASGRLYVGLGNGLITSGDGGQVWTASSLSNVKILGLAGGADGAIYAKVANASGDSSLYRGSGDGLNWTAVNSSVPAATNGPFAIAVDGSIYAGSFTHDVYDYMPVGNPRLVSVSSRGQVLTGDGVVIAGFVIQGGNKTVLLTAAGPSLSDAGLSHVLANPQLRLVDSGGNVIASNDDWHSNANADGIIATQGAPGVANESALLLTLAPGAYTVIMEGVANGTGTGLVAVNGVANPSDTGSLINLSTRGVVGSGDDVLIAGVILLDGPCKLLFSARGPSLTAAGVAGAVTDPMIELHDVNGALLAVNDNLADAPNLSAVVATGRAPTDARESAILQQLQPGVYTLVVRGSHGSRGVALVAVDQVD